MGDVSYAPLIKSMRWSYSRVSSFEQCPYKWYLHYIYYPDRETEEQFFSSYGSMMHSFIADYYTGRRTKEELVTQFLITFPQISSLPVQNKSTVLSYFNGGLDYLNGLRPPENEVLEVEQTHFFKLKDRDFVAIIDRVEKTPNGKLLLIDNKSRALKKRSSRKKPTKSDEELDSYLKQLYLYSIPFKEKYGQFPDRLCFNCFRTQTFIEEPFKEEVLEDVVDWVLETIENITYTEEFKPSVDYFKCSYLCDMNSECEYYETMRGNFS